MSKHDFDNIQNTLRLYGYEYATCSRKDGETRYRLTVAGKGFNDGRGLYTVVGLKAAIEAGKAFLAGYKAAKRDM